MTKGRILIVEDEFIIAADLEQKVSGLGFDVVATVGTGSEALEVASRESIDMAFMDIVLHGAMDGVETAQELRSRFQIPVVYLTSYSDDETVHRARHTEPLGFIVKPFELRDLRIMLETGTYRARAEKQLKVSEHRFRQLVEQAMDGIFVISEAGQIHDVNSTGVAMAQLSREDMEKKCFFDLCQMDLRYSLEYAARRRSSTQPVSVEGRFYDPNGDSLVVEMRIGLLDKGPPKRFLILVRDISETKKAEKEKSILQDQLIQTAKLASLGTMSAGIAHELNNPLTAIRGYSEILEQGNKSLEDVRRLAGKVTKAANRMGQIIRHLSLFSRQSTAEDWEELDINRPIEDSVAFLDKQLKNSDISCELGLMEDLPKIFADHNHLESVMQNLIINSRDAFNENGVVDNRKVVIATQFDQTNQRVQIIYRDNAGGMPEHICKRIFDPFFTTKKKGQGTGLGMSITHGIVEALEGCIAVESEEGSGSVFTLDFPQSKDNSKYQPHGTNQESSLATAMTGHIPRILVVDDETEIVNLIRIALESDFRVTTETDSQRAAEMLKEQQYDLLITDLMMPKVSGEQLLTGLRAIGDQTPVIVMTGNVNSSDEDAILQKGAQRILPKPFKNMRVLKNCIHEALEKQQLSRVS